MFITMSHCSSSRPLGFCYSIDTETSLELLLDILLLPDVIEILKLWICRTSSFMCSGSSSIGRCWCEPSQSPGSGPGRYLSGSVASSSSPTPSGELSSTDPASSSDVSANRDISPIPMSLQPAHPCPHQQGQLYCASKVRCRAHCSPECCSRQGSGTAIQFSNERVVGEGIFPLYLPPHSK